MPLRNIFEETGVQINWDDSTKTITAYKKDRTIKLQANSKKAYINDIYFDLDVAPIIINGRTMVPLRFICESIGCDVEWEADTKKIIIDYNERDPNPIPRIINPSKPVELILNGKQVITNLIASPSDINNEAVLISINDLKKLFSNITFELSEDFNNPHVPDITAYRDRYKCELNIGSHMVKFYFKDNDGNLVTLNIFILMKVVIIPIRMRLI